MKKNIKKYETMLKEDLLTEGDLHQKIGKCIQERNYFWWGCIIGIQYGKLSTIRCNENEEPDGSEFIKIVRVKYSSPYKPYEHGEVIKWY